MMDAAMTFEEYVVARERYQVLCRRMDAGEWREWVVEVRALEARLVAYDRLARERLFGVRS